jgi:hypothetical protein
MEFKIASHTTRSFSTVAVCHKDEPEYTISCRGYSSAKPGAKRDDGELEIFEEINDFIATLSEAKQEKLFNLYGRLESAIASYGDPTLKEDTRLTDVLDDIAVKIYEIVKFEDLRAFITTYRKITFPSELTVGYETTDKITHSFKQKTYLKDEYMDLTAVILGLRCMIPIWGSFLPISKVEDGSKWKEYRAYALLDNTSIKATPVFDRLETYIKANTKEEDYELAVVFNHLSGEEIPAYLMALAVIRKLSVAPLSHVNPSDHLMKVVYNYVCSPKNKTQNIFGDNIKRKTDDEGMANDSNGSVWDIFKMKESISTGELVIFEDYVNNFMEAAQAIDGDVDIDRLKECVKYATAISNYDYKDSQITITIWVLSTVIAPCVVEMFDRKTLLTGTGIAQAILWKWGFVQLAALLTAEPIKLEKGQIHSVPPRVDINDENMRRLDIIYPYTLPDSGKLGISTNVGVRDIEIVALELLGSSWQPRCSVALASECDRADIHRQIDPTPDLRDELAELLCDLDEFKR